MPRWLVWSLVAIAIWGCWLLIGKATRLDATFLTALSGFGVVAVALPLLLSPGLRKGDNLPKGLAYAFVTGLFGNLGNLTLLKAFKLGESSIVSPFTCLYPLVTVLLARVWLKEKLNPVQGLGFLLALAAIVLFGYLSAGENEGKSGPWLPWASATVVAFGIAAVTQKVATNHISNELSLVGFAAAFVPVSIFILALGGPYDWKLPRVEWIYVILYGTGIGLGTLALFAAYRWGNASVVTAITGLNPAVAALLAIPVFHETFTLLKGVALVLALAAGTALTYEGRREPHA